MWPQMQCFEQCLKTLHFKFNHSNPSLNLALATKNENNSGNTTKLSRGKVT